MVKSKLEKENAVREVYDSENRDHPAIEEIKSLIRYRDLILQLIRRDLVSRYKRSYLGVAWTMLNPLGTMIILAVVFSRVFNDIEAYPVFLLSGLLIWNFFSQSTTHCMSSILWGSNLFDRIYMPRTSFLISSIGTAIINFFLSLIPLILIMLFTSVTIPATFLYIPIPLLLVSIFSLGVGLILASFSLFFPDIEQMYSIFLRAMMYATPVLVPEEILGGILNGLLLKLNPLYYLINDLPPQYVPLFMIVQPIEFEKVEPGLKQ